MADYIPRSDNDFLAWTQNFDTYANAHFVELGLIIGDMTPISTGLADFDAKMTANVTAQQAAQSARQDKNDSRDSLESAIRVLVW